MGVLAALLNTAIDALDEYGKEEKNIREGYDFYCDPETRSVDDITVKAGNSELVLAAIWKNLPGYKPSLPNMAEAFKNIGWSVIDTVKLEELRKENAELKANKTNVFAELNTETAESNEILLDKVADLEEELKIQKKINMEMITPALDKNIKRVARAKELIKDLLLVADNNISQMGFQLCVADAKQFLKEIEND